MSFVLDASVTLSFLLPDEWSEQAEAVIKEGASTSAFVPSLWWYEVRNALLYAERKKRISAAQFGEFLELLEELPIQMIPPSGNENTVKLAIKHKLSVYDAAYLSLAAEQKLPLATLDESLREAALAEKIRIMI